ncbi:MAG: hypothetical protein JWL83_486 [Actinomycetia bacterium]|nr:hypothetical protein [Actinomycetes bacterium]
MSYDDARMVGRAPPPPEALRSDARRVYGLDPEGYEAGRPDYPERVYDVLTARCGLTAGTAVVEIGPGTGLVTRQLLARGARVVAVEPDRALAAHLVRTTASADLAVILSTFEDAPLDDAHFDLAVAAMSFHWVDQDVGMAKLGRVVRPGGWVALWWTVFGDPGRADPFHDATKDLVGDGSNADEPGRPQFELDVAARQFDLVQRAGLVDVEAELLPWTVRMSSMELRALYASMIAVRRRPQPEQQRVLDTLVSIADDEFGGVVERPFVTSLYTARRL